jgi:hypothetical protein
MAVAQLRVSECKKYQITIKIHQFIEPIMAVSKTARNKTSATMRHIIKKKLSGDREENAADAEDGFNIFCIWGPP